jgi:O-antigen/teichoic acid export membrane protein
VAAQRSIPRNFTANLFGTGWSAVLSFVLVPIYVRLMGIEAYGLVGFFAVLQATLNLLDLGLSATMNREMARYSALPDAGQEARDFVRTLEAVYWQLAVFIGLTLAGLAPLLATRWLRSDTLPATELNGALLLIALVSALQWPVSLYTNGLLGLQAQVLVNGINAVAVTIRGIGAVLVLSFVSRTPTTFFAWQAVASALQISTLAVALWQCLPPAARRARFRVQLLKKVRQFAAGVTGIMAAGLLLTQLDSIVLSKLMPLDVFGSYSVASLAANALYMVAGVVYASVFPRMTVLAASGDIGAWASFYHRSCQTLSVLLLPAASVLVLFAPEVLFVWTGRLTVAEKVPGVLSILATAGTLSGLFWMPYGAQLAEGWTRLMLLGNGLAVVVLTPLAFVLASLFGPRGGASVRLILSLGYILIVVPLMHRRILKGEFWRWCMEDVGRPLLAVAVTTVIGRWLLGPSGSRVELAVRLVAVAGSALVAAALVTPWVRGRAVLHLRWARHGR